MYSDVLGQASTLLVNIKLAKIFNLNCAVYIAALTEIVEKVSRKKTYDPITGFFNLDRKYVEEKTTLSELEQLECDTMLMKVGIIAESEEDKNKIAVDIKKVFDLIISDDKNEIEKVSKLVEKTKKAKSATKKDYIIAGLKKCLVELEPDETVRAKEEDWIEAIYGNRHLTKAVIQVFQRELNEYTSDQATKIKLVELAMTSGYATFDWIKSTYERNNRGRASLGTQRVSTGVMEGVEF